VWNLALDQRRFAWRQRGYSIRSAEQCRHLTNARADLPWLGDLPAQSAQQVSNRLRRTISEIAKLRAAQARRRQDFTHKLTTDLAKNHGWVAVEDLRVKAMTGSAKATREEPGRNVRAKAGLNRAVLDNAPYERRRQLAYKASRFGSELRLVRPAGTSQRCSVCGVRDPGSRPGCGGCSDAPLAAMSSTPT
jgi:putative transposase